MNLARSNKKEMSYKIYMRFLFQLRFDKSSDIIGPSHKKIKVAFSCLTINSISCPFVDGKLHSLR